MKLEAKEIYTFKLVTGEEVVAEVLEVEDDHYIISKPTTIMPNNEGKMQMVPSAFTMELDADVQINTSAIAMIFVANESVKASYKKATTGIEVPEKKIITG
jgi:hypothetical protein